MWMEAKIMISGIGIFLIAVVIAFTILVNIFLGFLLIMSIGFIIFSDIIMGWMITKNRANYVIDKPPSGKCVAVILTLDNMIDFEWAKKGPHGSREFTYNGRMASVIDDGKYPIHLPNGVLGFLCHEKCEKNINPFDTEMADKLNKEFRTNDIKEMYAIAKDREAKDAAGST